MKEKTATLIGAVLGAVSAALLVFVGARLSQIPESENYIVTTFAALLGGVIGGAFGDWAQRSKWD